MRTKKGAKVLYMSGEEFVSEYIESLKNKVSESFRRKYRTLDCFLMDDIQFVVGKDASEKEFFYTFNALFDSKKQIVLTSDRTPSELDIDKRLASRLLSGIVAEIKQPDIETRIAILRKKRETHKFNIPDDVITFIGTKLKTSIREMEGSLIRLDSYCGIHGTVPTVEIAKEILADMAAYWQIDFVRNGEIFVKVKSPAAAQELQLRKNSIIRCINRYFDRPWIISVKAI